jgi:hypothetical protein
MSHHELVPSSAPTYETVCRTDQFGWKRCDRVVICPTQQTIQYVALATTPNYDDCLVENHTGTFEGTPSAETILNALHTTLNRRIGEQMQLKRHCELAAAEHDAKLKEIIGSEQRRSELLAAEHGASMNGIRDPGADKRRAELLAAQHEASMKRILDPDAEARRAEELLTAGHQAKLHKIRHPGTPLQRARERRQLEPIARKDVADWRHDGLSHEKQMELFHRRYPDFDEQQFLHPGGGADDADADADADDDDEPAAKRTRSGDDNGGAAPPSSIPRPPGPRRRPPPASSSSPKTTEMLQRDELCRHIATIAAPDGQSDTFTVVFSFLNNHESTTASTATSADHHHHDHGGSALDRIRHLHGIITSAPNLRPDIRESKKGFPFTTTASAAGHTQARATVQPWILPQWVADVFTQELRGLHPVELETPWHDILIPVAPTSPPPPNAEYVSMVGARESMRLMRPALSVIGVSNIITAMGLRSVFNSQREDAGLNRRDSMGFQLGCRLMELHRRTSDGSRILVKDSAKVYPCTQLPAIWKEAVGVCHRHASSASSSHLQLF